MRNKGLRIYIKKVYIYIKRLRTNIKIFNNNLFRLCII